MVDTGELDNYLNDQSAQDGDMIEILGEGNFNEKENPTTHQKYKSLDLPVKLNGQRTLVYSPNTDAIKVFQGKFGKDTKSWVGCKFAVKIYPKTAYGQTKNAILPKLIAEIKV